MAIGYDGSGQIAKLDQPEEWARRRHNRTLRSFARRSRPLRSLINFVSTARSSTHTLRRSLLLFFFIAAVADSGFGFCGGVNSFPHLNISAEPRPAYLRLRELDRLYTEKKQFP